MQKGDECNANDYGKAEETCRYRDITCKDRQQWAIFLSFDNLDRESITDSEVKVRLMKDGRGESFGSLNFI